MSGRCPLLPSSTDEPYVVSTWALTNSTSLDHLIKLTCTVFYEPKFLMHSHYRTADCTGNVSLLAKQVQTSHIRSQVECTYCHKAALKKLGCRSIPLMSIPSGGSYNRKLSEMTLRKNQTLNQAHSENIRFYSTDL